MAICDICEQKISRKEDRRIFAFESGMTHKGICEQTYINQRKKWENCTIECKGKNFFPKCLKIGCGKKE